MRCLKITHHRLICSLLFVLSLFFISLFGVSLDSYALADQTFDLSPDFYTTLCSSYTSDHDICGYSYVKIEEVNAGRGTRINCQAVFPPSGSGNWDFGNSYNSFTIFAPLISGSYTDLKCKAIGWYHVTLTLTDNYSNCPICETCQTCPEIPENPYDPKLDDIKRAIIIVGAVPLVLYFFYCIYRIIIGYGGGRK